jgi:hypothetical protein
MLNGGNMTSFLNEVAAELVSRGISEPTSEQIADAMVGRINRQGQLWERIFGCSWRGQAANGTRAFVSSLAESVYTEIREDVEEIEHTDWGKQ